MGYKLSDDDFKNQASLDNAIEELGGSDVSDENGYTPLCYIALNGSRSDLIVYLVNDKDAHPSITCDKGKNPLEFACMAGNAEAVRALIGSEVVKRDENGEVIYSTTLAPPEEQPKKDAAGNPIPKRDDEDNIIYIKYKIGITGIPNGIPFPLQAAVDNELASSPVIQYTAHRVLDPEKSTKDKPVYIVDEVYKVPPDDKDHPLPSKIIYKLDKDGNHQPMRDDDGTPLKQYDKKTKKDINATDEKGNIINKNKFEYVWDYECLPEYEANYLEEKDHIKAEYGKPIAAVTPQHVLAASSNKDPSILMAMADKYSDYWDPTLAGYDTYFNSDKESPLIAACRMQALDSVKFILGKIYGTGSSGTLRTINAIFHRTIEYVKDDPNTAEYACKIASDLNDKTLINAFKDCINVTYLNYSKGTGSYTGDLNSETCDRVYALIDAGVLSRGSDPSKELLTEKWPYTKPDPWTDGWPSP